MDSNTLTAILAVAPLIFFGWVFYLDAKYSSKTSLSRPRFISPKDFLNQQMFTYKRKTHSNKKCNE